MPRHRELPPVVYRHRLLPVPQPSSPTPTGDSGLITGRIFPAWAVPVKVEDLKASLRSQMATAERRAALVDCAILPPELIDMIMDHMPDLRQQRQRQWTTLYELSSRESFQLGTIIQRALLFPSVATALRQRLYGFILACRQRRKNTCEHCQRCLDYLNTPPSYSKAIWSSNWKYTIDYEDFLVDIANPFDSHPANKELFEALACDIYCHVAAKELADQWNIAVDGNVLFTSPERHFLQGYGVDCWVQRDMDGRHTTALLLSQGTIPERTETSHFENGTVRSLSMLDIPALKPKDRTTLKSALQELDLTACAQLERGDCSVKRLRPIKSWPRLVQIQQHSIDCTEEDG